MVSEKEVREKIDEKRFARSPEEEQRIHETAMSIMEESNNKVQGVIKVLLEHAESAVGYLLGDLYTFQGKLVIDWSVENAEKYLEEKDEKEARLFAGSMSREEAAEFAHHWISYIKHCMYRSLLELNMPANTDLEDFEAEFPELCRLTNEEEEAERVRLRCEELYEAFRQSDDVTKNFALDGDDFYETVKKRAASGIDRVDRKLKRQAKRGQKEE